MKKIFVSILFVGLFIAGVIFGINGSDNDKLIKRTQIIMGTVVEIQLREIDKNKSDELFNLAFNEIKRIDNLFSNYKSESIISLINQRKFNGDGIDKEIISVLLKCDEFNKLTNGAFDASLGSLLQVWGFEKEEPKLPTNEEIKSALKKSGWSKLKFVNNNILFDDDLILNLGAIAKGYAVDKAYEVLDKYGVNEFLINAGGEVKTKGLWQIGIQHPRNENEMIAVVNFKDMAIATSGDYEQYFIHNGKRYHHIFDGRTGYPADNVQSVTVIARDDLTADALATGLFVLGIENGISLADSLSDVEAMFVDGNGKIYFTKGFKNYLRN